MHSIRSLQHLVIGFELGPLLDEGFGGEGPLQEAQGGLIAPVIVQETAEVPVPAALPMLIAGVGLFGLYARRRRKAA